MRRVDEAIGGGGEQPVLGVEALRPAVAARTLRFTATGHPRGLGLRQRMMVVDPAAGAVMDATVGDLGRVLGPGDVVVVNDAATLPASIPVVAPSGRPHELRLVTRVGQQRWRAVVLGPGSWRDDTDHRPRPEALVPGDRLRTRRGDLVVLGIDPQGLVVEIPGGLAFLYAVGSPIQYSYADRSIGLHEVQAPFAARPWAVEMPSAGRPLRWELVLALRRRGAAVERLSHAAGLSATGDPGLDATLPFPERFEIPRRTALAVASARRVIAIGTSVVRALEGSMGARKGITNLVLGPRFRPRIVTGLLSGVHEPGTSHHALLEAFADGRTLARADRHAAAAGYEIHEFGDSTLVLPGAAASLLDGAARH